MGDLQALNAFHDGPSYPLLWVVSPLGEHLLAQRGQVPIDELETALHGLLLRVGKRGLTGDIEPLNQIGDLSSLLQKYLEDLHSNLEESESNEPITAVKEHAQALSQMGQQVAAPRVHVDQARDEELAKPLQVLLVGSCARRLLFTDEMAVGQNDELVHLRLILEELVDRRQRFLPLLLVVDLGY